MKSKTQLKHMLRKMADKWPSEFVARNRIGEFTGGMLTPSTMKKWDYQGRGIDERFYMNRMVVYPVQAVIDFIIANSQMQWNEDLDYFPKDEKKSA